MALLQWFRCTIRQSLRWLLLRLCEPRRIYSKRSAQAGGRIYTDIIWVDYVRSMCTFGSCCNIFVGHASATSNVTLKEIIKRLHIIESEWIWSVSYQKHWKSPFYAAMISSFGISFCKMSRILTLAPESWTWEMRVIKDYFPLHGQMSFILYFHDDLRI